MDITLIGYSIYLVLSSAITYGVGRSRFRNGRYFLVDIFSDSESVADAVNRLLIVGFYLINFGYVALNLRAEPVATPAGLIESLSSRLGVVLLVLGLIHFTNMLVLSRFRHRRVHPVPRRPVPPPPPPYFPNAPARPAL